MSDSPLVLVTRPAGGRDPLVAALHAHDVRVVAVPTVAIAPLDDTAALETALADTTFDWVIVTSAAGVRAVKDLGGRTGAALVAPERRWAAVGPTTASALREAGIEPDLVARAHSGVGLAAAILADRPDRRLEARRVLLARSDVAAPDLPDALRQAGGDVVDLPAYRTVEGPAASSDAIAAALSDPSLAVVVAASGSAVRGLIALASSSALVDVARRTPIVVIGPWTAAVAGQQGFKQIHQATDTTVDALAASVVGLLAVSDREPVLARRTP